MKNVQQKVLDIGDIVTIEVDDMLIETPIKGIVPATSTTPEVFLVGITPKVIQQCETHVGAFSLWGVTRHQILSTK